MHARRHRPPVEGALSEALLSLEEELYPLAAAMATDGVVVLGHRGQTLRRLGGRQPLCGIGVTSVIAVTSRPAAWRERMAASRPEPGPRTKTSMVRMPCSIARLAVASAVTCAAK